jgi:hypothetical protein
MDDAEIKIKLQELSQHIKGVIPDYDMMLFVFNIDNPRAGLHLVTNRSKNDVLPLLEAFTEEVMAMLAKEQRVASDKEKKK